MTDFFVQTCCSSSENVWPFPNFPVTRSYLLFEWKDEKKMNNKKIFYGSATLFGPVAVGRLCGGWDLLQRLFPKTVSHPKCWTAVQNGISSSERDESMMEDSEENEMEERQIDWKRQTGMVSQRMADNDLNVHVRHPGWTRPMENVPTRWNFSGQSLTFIVSSEAQHIDEMTITSFRKVWLAGSG